MQKVKVGDRVKFLNDVGEGVVIKVETSIAIVEDESGFDHEYDLAELLPVGGEVEEEERYGNNLPDMSEVLARDISEEKQKKLQEAFDIKYANENASDEEVLEVSKLSNSHDFIEKLPEKYNTKIGENGVRLSGGEKQRISIARAMIKKSSIILLDEATSSLDSQTESKIQEALNTLTKNKTTIVIAHRLSTILNSNNIYLIDSGKVIDSGKHENLLIKSSLYKNFYEKQIQK